MCSILTIIFSIIPGHRSQCIYFHASLLNSVITFYNPNMLPFIYRVPTLPGKLGILSFTFPGLENAWNLFKKFEKLGILTQNLGKKHVICKFSVSRFTFPDVIYKKSSDLHFCDIYIINTNTVSKPNWPGMSLVLPGNFVSPEKWESCI